MSFVRRNITKETLPFDGSHSPVEPPLMEESAGSLAASAEIHPAGSPIHRRSSHGRRANTHTTTTTDGSPLQQPTSPNELGSTMSNSFFLFDRTATQSGFVPAANEMKLNGVDLRRDVTREGLSVQRVVFALTHAVNPVFLALKTALLVTLPLCLLVFMDSTRHLFKASSLMPVFATSQTQLMLGQQIAAVILLLQGTAWLLVWGTFASAIGTINNQHAWWGLAFLAVVLISFTRARGRRLMMSFTFIIMQIQRTEGGSSLIRPTQVAGDMVLGAMFALFQALVPFPLLVTRKTDMVFAEAWKEVAAIATDLRLGVWSGRVFSGGVSASETACDELGQTINSLEELINFCSYEPFEKSMYNELRNVRLSLLRKLLVVLYSSCSTAKLVTSMVTSETRAPGLALQGILQEPLNSYLRALSKTLKRLGASLHPAETIERGSFDELLKHKDALVRALHECRNYVAFHQDRIKDMYMFYAFWQFHLLLTLLAEELHTFAQQMEHFEEKRVRTWRRILAFFFLDTWHDIRDDLLNRILLVHHEDRQSLKDGLKLAVAYCAAVAFTTDLNSDIVSDSSSESGTNVYFFGMAIIMGVGLPTASESIEVGVHRIAGMAFAMSVGYIARWYTNNTLEAVFVVTCGTFIAACFRSNKRYMHVAFYASIICPAAYGISANRVVMIGRVVTNCFAVMAYFVVCTMMFPVNPFRILWNNRAVLEKNIAESIALLSSVAQLPVDEEHRDVAESRMKIAAEYIKAAHVLLDTGRNWIEISSKEPAVVKVAFPYQKMCGMQIVLTHTVAGLEIWLFSLQVLHREHGNSAHPIVLRMVSKLVPILRDVEVASNLVFQDLIDSMDVPLQWSLVATIGHLNDFVALRGRLQKAYVDVQREVILAQSMEVRHELINNVAALVGKNVLSHSFVAALRADPRNSRPVNEYGPATKDATAHWSSTATAASFAFGRGGGGGRDTDPFSLAQFGGGMPSESSGGGLGNHSCMVANMSFRAPIGNLPLDIDILAFMVSMVSITTLISSLEQMVPYMVAINKFERGRFTPKKVGFREFFMCPAQSRRRNAKGEPVSDDDDDDDDDDDGGSKHP